MRTIFEDPEGNIRDPQIHYDARKLVFAYLPKGKRHYSLYEINLDGTGLKQLTGRGEDVSPGMEDYQTYSPPGWDDFEPTYLPDGQIIFCSTRANRYVQCWMTQVGTLYKCAADGSHIRALSANVEHDNTPWVLANGQVAYMRWEYVDRFHMGYHHLWSMNPDGTRQMVLYGNQINHGTILAPKPVPHSPKLVVTWSPGHGMREHYGKIALIDPRLGPDDPQGVQYISQDNIHCDPWAFSENHFLVANKTAMELLNGRGETEVLYRLPEELAKAGYWIGEPRPVMRRAAGTRDRRPDRPAGRPWHPGAGQHLPRPQDAERPAGHGQESADLRGAAQADQLCRRDVRNVRRRDVLRRAADRFRPGFRRRQRLFQAAGGAQLPVPRDGRQRTLREAHALVHVRHAGREHHLHRLPRTANRDAHRRRPRPAAPPAADAARRSRTGRRRAGDFRFSAGHPADPGQALPGLPPPRPRRRRVQHFRPLGPAVPDRLHPNVLAAAVRRQPDHLAVCRAQPEQLRALRNRDRFQPPAAS